ncbi:M23 family metallopeptidase [Streptomyces radicis]|uniref:M23 family metallopeptidase n=1 Tax=Streptomyces radicis TaxID=1750517 RepID=A0A3A9WB93_9ACTN|nr:M23 family metallopeptidase [Streptomyces radicis]RKN19289.1 M23 family metallopeptidase [Streptomyces radicis]
MTLVATLLSTFLFGVSPEAAAWPVPGASGASRPLIARGFEPPPQPWSAGHRGVDLITRAGAEVRAAVAGRVVFAGSVAGRGVISIELPTGPEGGPAPRVTYEPVRASVAVGDEVAAGDVVGRLAEGPFHCAEPCLHWGLRVGETYRDPLSLLPERLLRRGPSRLLPTTGVPVPGEAGDPVEGNPDGEVGDHLGGRRPGAAEVAHRRVDHALEQRRDQARLLVAESSEHVDEHAEQPAPRRMGALRGRLVQLARGAGQYGSVPLVHREGQLDPHKGLRLGAGRGRRVHRGRHPGGPRGRSRAHSSSTRAAREGKCSWTAEAASPVRSASAGKVSARGPPSASSDPAASSRAACRFLRRSAASAVGILDTPSL